MVNENGETVVLRGWGVGSWMNPEGFMIGGVPLFAEVGGFNDFALPRRFERGRTMETTVRELAGTAYAKEFAKKWYHSYLSEEDIRLMADMGYNSVRLPVSARLFLAEEPEIQWIEGGFAVLEQVLDWCEKYHVYAILDLHGAPGGQSALPATTVSTTAPTCLRSRRAGSVPFWSGRSLQNDTMTAGSSADMIF